MAKLWATEHYASNFSSGRKMCYDNRDYERYITIMCTMASWGYYAIGGPHQQTSWYCSSLVAGAKPFIHSSSPKSPTVLYLIIKLCLYFVFLIHTHTEQPSHSYQLSNRYTNKRQRFMMFYCYTFNKGNN